MRVHALAFAVAVGCSSKSADAPPPAPPVFALYGPPATTKLTPYPSNRYTKPDASTATGMRVDIRASNTADSVVAAYPKTMADLDTLDGFSTVGGVYVNFSGAVDPASFTRAPDGYRGADAPAVLLDVDDASPDKGKPVDLLPLYATTSDGLYDYVAQDDTLVFQPARPLRPRTRYLFVLTDRITANGARIAASDDTRALLSGATQGAYADSVRSALGALESTGVPRANVVLATVFTTETVHDELVAGAKNARATPAPKPSALTVVEGPTADDRVRFAFTFPSPEYRKPKPDGRFEIASGAPKVQSTPDLSALVAFAKASKSGPRPVVIFGHGLGGDKEGVWGTAERLASLSENGVAVFGIDAPEHGSRATTKEGGTLGPVFAFFGIDSASKTESFVISRARDNFRQMALDQLELVRLIESLSTLDVLPAGAPDGVPDLDTSKILYLGHSFGSVMGGTIAAIAPEIRAATWNVGGAGLTTLLRDSNTFKFIIDALRPAGTPPGDVNRFFATIQAIVDPGDAVNYAKYVTLEALPGVDGWSARDVLLQEVSGDAIVPNSTSELLARAAGLVHQLPARHEVPGLATKGGDVTANLASGATGVFAQFEVGADGKVIDHGSLIFTPEAQAQYVPFFRSALAGPHATVPPPFSK